MSEQRKRLVPVSFLTSQARSAHPFFLGAGAQTNRSENVWVDEQLQIRRRPALMRQGDVGVGGIITGMFEYQYRSRGSKPVRMLVGMNEAGQSIPADMSVLSSGVLNGRTADPEPDAASGNHGRFRLTAPTITQYGTATFDPGEALTLYWGGSGSGDGTVVSSFDAELVVDNLDYAAGDGEIVIRTDSSAKLVYTFFMSLGGGSGRVVGQSSGANVRFGGATVNGDFGSPSHPRQSLWRAQYGNQNVWQEGSAVTFTQYGQLLLFTDDSFLYPVRVWSGGYAGARTMIQAPRGALLTTHQGRVVLADLEQDGSAVHFSRAGDPYSWEPALDPQAPLRIQIEQDDRDNITGVAQSYRGDLYIWKGRSLHRLTGLINVPQIDPATGAAIVTFQRQTVTRSIGCASHRSIVHVGNDIFWMSDRGVHSMEATEKFGDVETSYLSFQVADIFDELNRSKLKLSQAVYDARLGLYVLGVATRGSKHMNKLLTYAIASRRWMTWDIGEFTSLELGPPVGAQGAQIYAAMVDAGRWQGGGVTATEAGFLAVLDFRNQVDFNNELGKGQRGTLTPISVVLEPGDVFAGDLPPEIRFPQKSVNRLQLYMVPVGDFEATVKYAWDAGAEQEATLNLNPRGDKTLTNGYKLGENEEGNELGSDDDTAVTSIPMYGDGHMLRFRIEDSNPTRLPYLHADLEAEIHDPDYMSSPR